MENKKAYSLIPLSAIQKNIANTKTPSEKHAENVKNSYLIMRTIGKTSFFIKATFRQLLIFNYKKQVIGYTKFYIQTQLTPESTDTEIKEAVKNFSNAHYKQVSINVYPQLKPIKGLL